MDQTILDRLAKRAPKFRDVDDSRLNTEIKKAVSKIKTKKSTKRTKSSRGGLSSMGARGVFLKDGGIYSRRVVVKASYIESKNEKARAKIRHHLNYAGRNTLEENSKSRELYSKDDLSINIKDKVDGFEKAPHMFNIIISPEDGYKIDLKSFTKDFVNTVEIDLKTKLDWVAGNHYDTNEPHVHLLIKGVDDKGKKLLMSRDYISRGLRIRASQTISKKLGLRDWDDIVSSLKLEVAKPKRCELDNMIVRHAMDGSLKLQNLSADAVNDLPKALIEKRLQYLETKELAQKSGDTWKIKEGFIEELKNIERSTSIVEKLSGSLKVDKKSCEILTMDNLQDRVIKGHVVERGYTDDIGDKEYLVVKSKEKAFIYVELEKFSEKSPAGVGEFIKVDTTKPFAGPKTSDWTINKVADGGIYDAKAHEQKAQAISLPPGVSVKEYVQVHVNRLEVLAKKNLVEKLSEGRYLIPKNYLERLALEAKKSKEGHKAHIKITRLSAAREAKAKLSMGQKL